MFRIGWFSTGRDEAARELLKTVWNAISRGEIKAEISLVFSNREFGEAEESDLFFKLVKSCNIPLVLFSFRKFKTMIGNPNWRSKYDKEVMKRIAAFHPDLCVLAGYMLIVGNEMCQKYKMINLHPALPNGPKGAWQDVIWKLIETKASKTGATMHLVTPELDSGPVVTFCTFSLRGEPFDKLWKEIQKRSFIEAKVFENENNSLFKLIREEELKREFSLILETIRAFSEGKVKIESGKVVNSEGRVIEGYDLTTKMHI